MTEPLQWVVAEVEQHLAEAGWDQPATLFALVETEQLLQAEPALERRLGLVSDRPGQLTPVQQDPLPAGPLDETLAGLVFGSEVLGVVLAQEVVVLPPDAEADLAAADDVAGAAARDPRRREVRMAAGVLRNGTRACLLRLRGRDGEEDERVSGPDLAPALCEALLQTLQG